MKTNIWRMPHHEHRTLCVAVARLIPTLEWRHSGLGMLQAYVYEGTTDELRVHVWCSELERPGIRESGLLHDHRFDLTSQILVGALTQVEYQLTPSDVGLWQLHEVVHARAAAGGKHAPNDGLVTPLPGRYAAVTRSFVLSAGEAYAYPKQEFHGTFLQTHYAVTVMTKAQQEEVPARIMAPYGQPVVHAFAEPLPRVAWQHNLDTARDLLLARWREGA